MIMRLDASDMARAFEDYNRDYYSYDGYEAMLDFYDSYDENMELDVIGICGDWTEYGTWAALKLDDMASDYDGYYSFDEWLEDNDLTDETYYDSDLTMDDYYEALAKKIEYYHTVIYLDNGDYLIGE